MTDPLPAATLLLVRDGDGGLEVFMVERHRRSDFAGGALVFPGGKLDPDDADPAWRERCTGAEPLSAEQLALAVAGIREAFEECGVLLARTAGAEALVAGERLERLRAAPSKLAELVAREELRLACDLLVPFAHWITPDFMPKRFDTHFFLVEAPADQVAIHDGSESVDSRWIRPEDAVDAAQRRECTIVFPTLLNLKKLARSATVDEALAAARSARVVTVQPRVEDGLLRIPEEAGYGVIAEPVSKLRGA